MSFAKDIKKHAKNVNVSLNDMVRGVLFKANELIILKTPVDTGQHRGGWIASLNVVSNGLGKKDKGGDSTISKANKIAYNALGKVYYLVNNNPGIEVLENGGFPNPPKEGTGKTINGYSRLAPRGMVRTSIAEIKVEIAKQVRQHRRGF